MRQIIAVVLLLVSQLCHGSTFSPKSHFSPTNHFRSSTYHRLVTLPPYYYIVERYAKHYQIPKALVFAIIEAESNFDANALSKAGAKGLMQLMDSNSRHWAIDPYNPDENIRIGTYLIAQLLQKYDSLPIALAAYNAGETAVLKYRGVPPFNETRRYIKRVIDNMRKYQ
uniref:Lytic transglycosylase n=1 Tax=Vibrio sp. 23023 TaxID=452803 RepID=A9M4R4_9VIBR|nr:lytic transglycosylase domain-containing protein [Vibrio sp. 23023]ABX77007.1 Lytic transglycosylase [Vibrio sp. 23023]